MSDGSDARISKAATVIKALSEEVAFLKKMLLDVVDSQRRLRDENKQLHKEFEQTKAFHMDLSNSQNDTAWFFVKNVNDILKQHGVPDPLPLSDPDWRDSLGATSKLKQ